MKLKFLILFFFALFLLPVPSLLAAPSPFAAVFIDDATEKALGPFPYDRSRYAEALKALREAGAKAVVLKFFIDKPKSAQGDEALASEIGKMKVYLQARLDPKETRANPMPPGMDLAERVRGGTGSLLRADSGWIPLEKFSRSCAGIGFVDLKDKDRPTEVPMALGYQKKTYPSLELLALEEALGEKARLELGKSLRLAGHKLPLNQAGEVAAQLPAKDEMDYLPFLDLVQGRFDKKRIEGKVVILGFDATNGPTLPTRLGPLRIHRLFFYSLESLYQELLAH